MSSSSTSTSPTLLSTHQWHTQLSPADRIHLRNLQHIGLFGLDVWSRKKPQPILLSLSVSLSTPFASAASSDSIDGSTIHYGKLSKNILSRLDIQTEWLSSHELAAVVEHVVDKTATSGVVGALEVEICYPKASILGDCAGYRYSISTSTEPFSSSKQISSTLYIKNVRIPSLIGVNAHERNRKQGITVSLEIDKCKPEASDGYVEVEMILMKTVEGASFDTLEALAAKAAQDIMKEFIEVKTPGANISIRVEKPVAVPLADAPIVEIYRQSKA